MVSHPFIQGGKRVNAVGYHSFIILDPVVVTAGGSISRRRDSG